MDDCFEVLENEFEDTRWAKDLKILNLKGFNNRNLLLNLLGELGNAENVFNYLRRSPNNKPCAVEQEESPEGLPLISPNDPPIPIQDYFSQEKKPSDFSPELEPQPIRIFEEYEEMKELSPRRESIGNLFRPPSFIKMEDSIESYSISNNSEDLSLSPAAVKKFNSVILADMSASMMLSSPLQELIKPSEPVIPLDLNAIIQEDSSESHSLPIQLSICTNSNISILPNSNTNSLSLVDKPPFPAMMNITDEQKLKNNSKISTKGLLKTREDNQLRSYIHFTDIFLAMILTTFVWWTCKEIYRLREALSECEEKLYKVSINL